MKMNKLEVERIGRIDTVTHAIKKAGKKIDFKKLLWEIMYQYGVSQRTALEYLNTAKAQNGNKNRD